MEFLVSWMNYDDKVSLWLNFIFDGIGLFSDGVMFFWVQKGGHRPDYNETRDRGEPRGLNLVHRHQSALQAPCGQQTASLMEFVSR